MASLLQEGRTSPAPFPSGTDGAEDIGRCRPLIMRRGGACSTLGPAAGDVVLLPDAGFVLEPKLYLLAASLVRGDFLHDSGDPQPTRPETALPPANACLARTSSPCSNASRLSLTATEIAAAVSACASSSSPQSATWSSKSHDGYARGLMIIATAIRMITAPIIQPYR